MDGKHDIALVVTVACNAERMSEFMGGDCVQIPAHALACANGNCRPAHFSTTCKLLGHSVGRVRIEAHRNLRFLSDLVTSYAINPSDAAVQRLKPSLAQFSRSTL